MTYDVAAVRAEFPALSEGAAHFDGPGGSQTPAAVADAVADTLRAAVANRGTVTRAEQRAEDIVDAARAAAADLVGGVAGGIVFGRSMTQLTYDVSRALAKGWGPGDEVLTSPFSFVASANCLLYEGARPVFCDVDPVTLNLDPDAAAAAAGERTVGILPVHIFGFPAAMPELEALAEPWRPHRTRACLYLWRSLQNTPE